MGSTKSRDGFPHKGSQDEGSGPVTEADFFPVDADFVCSGGACDFDLYAKPGGQFLLYRAAGALKGVDGREVFKKRPVTTLYILTRERGRYLDFVENRLLQVTEDEASSVRERSAALYRMSATMVDDLFSDPQSRLPVHRSRKTIEGLARFIDRTPDALCNIMDGAPAGPFLVTHAINVSVFGMAIGGPLGLSGEEDVRTIGMGCLFSDLGMKAIPEKIINKPARLSRGEWAIMKRHPELAVRICRKHGGVPEEALTAIVQHHERLDGSGYPQGLKGEEITPGARVIAVADVFDSLTSDRPYRPAFEIFPALKLMRDEFADKLDRRVYRELVMSFTE